MLDTHIFNNLPCINQRDSKDSHTRSRKRRNFGEGILRMSGRENLTFRVNLPWPPTTNSIWRTVVIRGRQTTLLSAEARRYRGAVAVALAGHGIIASDPPVYPEHLRLAVTLDLSPPAPSKRRRPGAHGRRIDIDNRIKSVLDACTRASLWADDSQIDRLVVTRCSEVAGGLAVMTVEVMP